MADVIAAGARAGSTGPLLASELVGVTARGLTVVRGGRRILTEVDLVARPGRVLGIIGPNGAGKSSLLKALAGIWPYDGRITVDGLPARSLSSRERARRIAYVPQQTELRSLLGVEQVVAQGRYAHEAGRVGTAPSADQRLVARAMDRVDVAELASRAFPELSQGQKQRVLIARALATGASTLLLDEPTSALDVGHALKLHALLRSLAGEGYCVVVVLHPLDQAFRWTDDALLLQEGRRVAHGPTPEVFRAGAIEPVFGVHLVPGGALGFALTREGAVEGT